MYETFILMVIDGITAQNIQLIIQLIYKYTNKIYN